MMAHKMVEGFYLNGAVVYIDDTVIYEQIGKHSWKCRICFWTEWPRSMSDSTKTSVFMTSMELLGHIFDESGVHLSEQRVQGTRGIPIPASVSDVLWK